VTRVLLRFLGGDRAGEANPLAGARGAQDSEAAKLCALSATILTREADTGGPRVFCISHTLGASFRFNRADADARFLKAFPGLQRRERRAASVILESCVREAAAPSHLARRPNWIRSWRNSGASRISLLRHYTALDPLKLWHSLGGDKESK
jgi:hypothetical protein